MSRPRLIEIQAPVGGLDRRLGFQSQPPFTSPAANNVWVSRGMDGRRRLGSRPGQSKAYATHFGGANDKPIVAIDSISIAKPFVPAGVLPSFASSASWVETPVQETYPTNWFEQTKDLEWDGTFALMKNEGEEDSRASTVRYTGGTMDSSIQGKVTLVIEAPDLGRSGDALLFLGLTDTYDPNDGVIFATYPSGKSADATLNYVSAAGSVTSYTSAITSSNDDITIELHILAGAGGVLERFALVAGGVVLIDQALPGPVLGIHYGFGLSADVN